MSGRPKIYAHEPITTDSGQPTSVGRVRTTVRTRASPTLQSIMKRDTPDPETFVDKPGTGGFLTKIKEIEVIYGQSKNEHIALLARQFDDQTIETEKRHAEAIEAI